MLPMLSPTLVPMWSEGDDNTWLFLQKLKTDHGHITRHCLLHIVLRFQIVIMTHKDKKSMTHIQHVSLSCKSAPWSCTVAAFPEPHWGGGGVIKLETQGNLGGKKCCLGAFSFFSSQLMIMQPHSVITLRLLKDGLTGWLLELLINTSESLITFLSADWSSKEVIHRARE